ncbi:MAG: sodium:solute symporter [Phycisphaerales bacterium]|nr:sodium:solute symporter [Phycisphaerales bacterium]
MPAPADFLSSQPVRPLLEPLDWAVLAGYFLLLIGVGWYFSRRASKSTSDYFLAARSMPGWAVALSLLATAQSSATFIGVPELSYSGDLRYLSANIGTAIAAIVVAAFFLPVYYRLNVATPYQMLETRFGPGARLAASTSYLVGRVMASGARIYIGALPFSLAIFGDETAQHLAVCIAGFILFGALFTLLGGVRAAIWTDVIQVGVYLGAALVLLLILWNKLPGSIADIHQSLSHPPDGGPSKLTILRLGIDPQKPWLGFNPADSFTLLTAVFGWSLFNMAAFGTDQDLTQRMLTCRSAAKAGRSLVVSAVLVTLPVLLLFFSLGLLLYLYDLQSGVAAATGPGMSTESTKALVRFGLFDSPAGVAGLLIAGMLAAGPAGINASLNSMSSSFVTDIYRHLAPRQSESHYLRIGRLGTIGAGIALGAFAVACTALRGETPLIDFALGVMVFAYAGLLGVFLTALFTRRGTSFSAIAAMITGAAAMVVLDPGVMAKLSTLRGVNLGNFTLAAPWRMLIGTALAMTVCCSVPASRPPLTQIERP